MKLADIFAISSILADKMRAAIYAPEVIEFLDSRSQKPSPDQQAYTAQSQGMNIPSQGFHGADATIPCDSTTKSVIDQK